ncbi:MAG: EamA family transporter [Gammaproteobacteria bacterium]|nr:EamA family transporter [Gammaproteobacteria bacterium]
MTEPQAPRIDLISGLLLLALGMVWGGSFFFAKIALSEVPPLTVALHRVFWAVPVLFLVVLWKGLVIPRSIRAWLCYFVMGALNNAIPFSLIFWGQTHIGSGLASILNSTTAFFGVIVAGIFLADERLTIKKTVGALCGVLGVATIMGIEALVHFSLQNLAQLAILGAALFYAFAGVWGRLFLREYPPIMNAFGMLVASTVLMFPVAIVSEGLPVLALSKGVWASIIAVAVLSTAVAYLLYFRILAIAGSANLMLVTLLIPPIGVGLSVAFLGEEMGAGASLGFVLIVIGLIITDGRVIERFRRQSV